MSLWFVPPPRQEECILEYILPTKPRRALSVISYQLSVISDQLSVISYQLTEKSQA
ncbi:hypothetical protein PN437_05980 [Microcystis aeruginosa CS-564/01]|nr:hypothetical protein [Microcystis aeruginosa CS-564/01]